MFLFLLQDSLGHYWMPNNANQYWSKIHELIQNNFIDHHCSALIGINNTFLIIQQIFLSIEDLLVTVIAVILHFDSYPSICRISPPISLQFHPGFSRLSLKRFFLNDQSTTLNTNYIFNVYFTPCTSSQNYDDTTRLALERMFHWGSRQDPKRIWLRESCRNIAPMFIHCLPCTTHFETPLDVNSTRS